MDRCDIPYLLKRARSHRNLAAAATCAEARCIHRIFVKKYQTLLAEIRRDQLQERRARPRLPFRNGACDSSPQESEAISAQIGPLTSRIGRQGLKREFTPFNASQGKDSLVMA